jgi:hypothetical protein
MESCMKVSIRKALLIILTVVGILNVSGQVQAIGSSQAIIAYATGTIVSENLCSPFELCQQAVVSGSATHLGAITGVLNERIDLTTGTYTGEAVFTTSNGHTIKTDYVGQVSAPDASGGVTFVEQHQIVGGTGRYGTATGELGVVGTASATGALRIVARGTLYR